MTTPEPRLEMLEEGDWTPEVREMLEKTRDAASGHVHNIFKTLAHHPKALKRWMVFANHVLFKSTLTARDREILILRTGWLCQAEYEWAQHKRIAKRAGLDEADIARIQAGPGAEGWAENERLLMAATEELHGDKMISDATWAGLAGHYGTEQMIDIVLTVANYNLVSMVLKTLRVPLDEGLEGFAP